MLCAWTQHTFYFSHNIIAFWFDLNLFKCLDFSVCRHFREANQTGRNQRGETEEQTVRVTEQEAENLGVKAGQFRRRSVRTAITRAWLEGLMFLKGATGWIYFVF